ncbi:hypothetical protein B0H13DRAFT_2172177, partial [Mycena leptocephala]
VSPTSIPRCTTLTSLAGLRPSTTAARAAAASILRMTSRTSSRMSSLSIHPSSSRPMAESSNSTHRRQEHTSSSLYRVASPSHSPCHSLPAHQRRARHPREHPLPVQGARTAQERARSRGGRVFRLGRASSIGYCGTDTERERPMRKAASSTKPR